MSRRRLAAVPDRPQRVVLYVRVSAVMGRSGDDFHSPDVQIGAMRRLTAGMQEVDLIDDDIDQTGRTFSRAGIEKIRKLAEAGAIDAVAVYNVSRFGRNVLESLQFLSWLADRGVTILSASEHVDTSTPSGRWMLTNMLAIAEMRSDEIGNEWGGIIARRAQAGKHHGRPPTGYRRRVDGVLEPDPIVGPAVTQAFARYAAGKQVRTLRRGLQAATGLMLATNTFKKMMANRTYRGVVHINAGGAAGIVEVPGAHEPLVDEPTWELVQARLARDRQVSPRLSEPKYPLSGLGRCAVCKGPTNHRLDKKSGRLQLLCGRRYEALGERCTGCGTPPAVEVEQAVLSMIESYVKELKYDVGAQAARLAKTQRAGLDAAATRRELIETRTAMTRAAEGWARGRMDDRTYDQTMAKLKASEEALVEALGRSEEVASMPEPGRVVALGERLLQLWPDLDGTQKNRALRDLVERVWVKPASYYREPAWKRIEVDWL